MSNVVHAPASAFVAGLSARHDDAATLLRRVFADRPAGFAPADLIARIEDAFSTEAGPKSYAPAEPGARPTEGWDPFDSASAASPFIDPVEEARREGFEEGFAAAAQLGGAGILVGPQRSTLASFSLEQVAAVRHYLAEGAASPR